MSLRPSRWLLPVCFLVLVACGGGGGDKPSPSPGGGESGGVTPPGGEPGTALTVIGLQLAQTHVLPPQGLNWTLSNTSAEVTATEALHLVGERSALAIVDLGAGDAESPQIEGWLGESRLGSVTLLPPSQFPPTEADGPGYAPDHYSAMLPDSWIQPGLELRALADNYQPSEREAIKVGADFAFDLRILPFYLFGANDSNSPPLSETALPAADAQAEMRAKWPVSELRVSTHDAGRIDWPYLVIPPRNDSSGTPQPAYRANSTNDYRDGFAGLAGVLGVVRSLRAANGEGAQAVHYYAPLLSVDNSGTFRNPGGGLGGGSTGVGDHRYTGIFIHEQGHAFGLPHAGAAFDDFEYPYEWGSLAGSAWGYDESRHEMLAPFVPEDANRFEGCGSDQFGGHARALDSESRCVKQDPMQSGAGDQAAGYRYATFSDYNTAVTQRYFEGRTTEEADGSHSYSGGRVVRDAAFPGGYKRWDRLDQQWVNFDASTHAQGLYGFNHGLPVQFDIPVYAIVVTMSYASTPGVTQVYPPLRFTGNLSKTIDPTNADDLADISPGGQYQWFCENNGCDYTLRVTYANGTIRHVLLQQGFRPWFGNDAPVEPAASDPLSGKSYRRWAVNVPDEGEILRIELLDTPMAWQGMPLLPTVLASR